MSNKGNSKKKRLKPKHFVNFHCCHNREGLIEHSFLECLCNKCSMLKKVTFTNSNKNMHTLFKQHTLCIKPKMCLFPVCLNMHNVLNIAYIPFSILFLNVYDQRNVTVNFCLASSRHSKLLNALS